MKHGISIFAFSPLWFRYPQSLKTNRCVLLGMFRLTIFGQACQRRLDKYYTSVLTLLVRMTSMKSLYRSLEVQSTVPRRACWLRRSASFPHGKDYGIAAPLQHDKGELIFWSNKRKAERSIRKKQGWESISKRGWENPSRPLAAHPQESIHKTMGWIRKDSLRLACTP